MLYLGLGVGTFLCVIPWSGSEDVLLCYTLVKEWGPSLVLYIGQEVRTFSCVIPS